MTKKLICFPFIDGNLQEYVAYDLNDSEREQVYNGERVINTLYSNRVIEWRQNEEVELTLHYKEYGRGRSSVTFYWADDNGHVYPMFIKDMDELLKQNIGVSNIHAIWTYIKRGANYGIKFVKMMQE